MIQTSGTLEHYLTTEICRAASVAFLYEHIPSQSPLFMFPPPDQGDIATTFPFRVTNSNAPCAAQLIMQQFRWENKLLVVPNDMTKETIKNGYINFRLRTDSYQPLLVSPPSIAMQSNPVPLDRALPFYRLRKRISQLMQAANAFMMSTEKDIFSQDPAANHLALPSERSLLNLLTLGSFTTTRVAGHRFIAGKIDHLFSDYYIRTPIFTPNLLVSTARTLLVQSIGIYLDEIIRRYHMHQ